MREETGEWLSFAREDLKTAAVTLAGERWAATSFHAQQAVEKALKALWEERTEETPPRTHNLVRLAKELGVPTDWLEDLDSLSRVYVVTRYPGALSVQEVDRVFDDVGAGARLDLARRIVEWVEQQLPTG